MHISRRTVLITAAIVTAVVIAGIWIPAIAPALNPLPAVVPAPVSVPSPPPATTPTAATTAAPSPEVTDDKRDRAFQAALGNQHLDVGSPVLAIQLGRSVCAELETPTPDVNQLVEAVQAHTGFSPADTGYVIGAAIAAYCPQNMPKLPTG